MLDRDLGAAGVRDHVGPVAVGDHDHAGGAGGGGRGGHGQVRQRAHQDRGVADGLAEPLLVQHLPVRGDDHAGAGPVLLGVAGADVQRLGGAGVGAELAGLADRVIPGDLPEVLHLARRIGDGDGGGHHQVGCVDPGPQRAQPGIELDAAESQQRKRGRRCHGSISTGPPDAAARGVPISYSAGYGA